MKKDALPCLLALALLAAACSSPTGGDDGTGIFTTPAQYRETVSLSGGAVAGNTAYYYDSSDDVTKGVFVEGRTVTVSPFRIAKYETTYELWYEVKDWAGNNGYTFANPGREGHDGTAGDPPTSAAKTKPVTTISWRDAVVWCNAYSEMSGKTAVYYTDSSYSTVLKTSTNDEGTDTAADKAVMKADANGYRLPTEAEWEYAARGGGTPSTTGTFASKWAGTNDEGALGTYAWYYANVVGDMESDGPNYGTHSVGTRTANNAQLYDMSGNVWEWCWDWYGAVDNETPATGAASGANRVVRGGSWFNYAFYCAVAIRDDTDPGLRIGLLGFRVVCP